MNTTSGLAGVSIASRAPTVLYDLLGPPPDGGSGSGRKGRGGNEQPGGEDWAPPPPLPGADAGSPAEKEAKSARGFGRQRPDSDSAEGHDRQHRAAADARRRQKGFESRIRVSGEGFNLARCQTVGASLELEALSRLECLVCALWIFLCTHFLASPSRRRPSPLAVEGISGIEARDDPGAKGGGV